MSQTLLGKLTCYGDSPDSVVVINCGETQGGEFRWTQLHFFTSDDSLTSFCREDKMTKIFKTLVLEN